MDIKPGQALDILLQNWDSNDQKRYNDNQAVIQSMAKIASVTWLDKTANAPESATALVGEMQILIPLAGLIDKDAEIARLSKEIEKIEKNLAGVESRLNNPAFVEKAKPEVIETARKQAEEQRVALEQLQGQLEKMKAL
jgi:valyl-tRNA synthetase